MNYFIGILAALLFSINLQAETYSGPQSRAMGGAGRATIVPGESAFLNPATIPYFGEYFGTLFYSQGEHPTTGEEQQFGVLLSDGVPERLFQGALAYVHGNLNPAGPGDITTQDMYGAASGLITRTISFGLSAHRFMYKVNGGAETIQWNGGAGLFYGYSKALQFALVANDLLNEKDSVPVAARLVRSYAVAGNFQYEKRFNIRLDLVRPDENNPEGNTDILTGIESEVYNYAAFRAGFAWRESQGPERRVFTTGFGFKGPKLRADYSFEKDTKVAGGSRHSFDLWMPF
jgi:hypothetical protein